MRPDCSNSAQGLLFAMAQLCSWHTARQVLCLGRSELHKKVGSRKAIRRALGLKSPKLVDNGG